MRRVTMMVTACTFFASLLAASGAQALVVSDQGTTAGVALVPGTRASVPQADIVTWNGPCEDPWLSPDLGGPFLPSGGLCYHGGAVMHGNETFDLTWDPRPREDWKSTRYYVEQFLRDVADGSGTLSSPYAVTPQYRDAGGRAGNNSLYAGGCIDYGSTAGATCGFGSANGSGAGNDYPANGCPVTGTNHFSPAPGGGYESAANDVCLTDSQIKTELGAMISQQGLTGHIEPGYAPLIVLMTPPGVETCLDSGGTLCSANGGSKAQFCSYHSELNVDGTEFAYVVQPWTALTGCDEPDAPSIPDPVDAQTLETDIGIRLVSPLSQSQLAAITDPSLNGWSALDGAEMDDNGGCIPLGHGLDSVTVGSSGQNPYLLQREFNNGGVIDPDPFALTCTPNVSLVPRFVVPSAIQNGDVVEFDGSKTISTLVVPKADYHWSFGDGTSAVGPSVEHVYSTAGNYVVTLTVTDRGGNVRSLAQSVQVSGPGGPPPNNAFQAGIQLMPQGLNSVARDGVFAAVMSNRTADGIATISIPRAAARRAHIKLGRGQSVVVGRGTVSGIKAGVAYLHLHLSHKLAAKLRRLGHVTLTLRLKLVAADGSRLTLVAAGHY